MFKSWFLLATIQTLYLHRHFPALMKEHLSHDVLLLCVTCHQLASHHGALLKQQVAAEHDLYANTTSQKFKEDSHLKRIKNHAR